MSLKGKHNAWIKPSGQFIAVGYMGHNTYASEYFKKLYGPDEYLDKLDELVGYGYPYQALHQKGWIRLLTWTDGQTKALGDCVSNDGRLDTINPALNSNQKETLQEWCMDNNFKYEKLFDLD